MHICIYNCLVLLIYVCWGLSSPAAEQHNEMKEYANTYSTTTHNEILPDCFTPPNAKVEHGSASTSVLLSLG